MPMKRKSTAAVSESIEPRKRERATHPAAISTDLKANRAAHVLDTADTADTAATEAFSPHSASVPPNFCYHPPTEGAAPASASRSGSSAKAKAGARGRTVAAAAATAAAAVDDFESRHETRTRLHHSNKTFDVQLSQERVSEITGTKPRHEPRALSIDVSVWSSGDVVRWLRSIGAEFRQFEPAFSGMDGAALLGIDSKWIHRTFDDDAYLCDSFGPVYESLVADSLRQAKGPTDSRVFSEPPNPVSLSRLKLDPPTRHGSGTHAVVHKTYYGKYVVAVKALLSTRLQPAVIERLRMEVKQTQHLRHTNIIQTIDSAIDEKRGLLVMEYAAGGNLEQLLKSQFDTLSYERRYNIALDIANGLVFLHGLKPRVVHGDVKPRNVLFTRPGGAGKLSDFGVSYPLLKSRGTCAYLAPECFATPPVSDERSDVYAFGSTILELWTGLRPYVGLSEVPAMRKDEKDQPRALPSTLPPAIAAIIRDCLCFNPADRPTAEEIVPRLQEAFESAVHSTVTEVTDVPPVVRAEWSREKFPQLTFFKCPLVTKTIDDLLDRAIPSVHPKLTARQLFADIKRVHPTFKYYVMGGAVRDAARGIGTKSDLDISGSIPVPGKDINLTAALKQFCNERKIPFESKPPYYFKIGRATADNDATIEGLRNIQSANGEVCDHEFTINALVYDAEENLIIDRCHAVRDIKSNHLRMTVQHDNEAATKLWLQTPNNAFRYFKFRLRGWDGAIAEERLIVRRIQWAFKHERATTETGCRKVFGSVAGQFSQLRSLVIEAIAAASDFTDKAAARVEATKQWVVWSDLLQPPAISPASSSSSAAAAVSASSLG